MVVNNYDIHLGYEPKFVLQETHFGEWWRGPLLVCFTAIVD